MKDKQRKKENYMHSAADLGTYLNKNDLSQILNRKIYDSSIARSLTRYNSVKLVRWIEWLDELLGQFYYYIPPTMVRELRKEAKIIMKKILGDTLKKNFSKKELFHVLCMLVIGHHKQRNIRTPRSTLQELSENCFSGKKLKPSNLLDAKMLIDKYGQGTTRKNPSLRTAILSATITLRPILTEGFEDIDMPLIYQQLQKMIERKNYPQQEPVKAVLILVGKIITKRTKTTVQGYVRKITSFLPKIQSIYPSLEVKESTLATAIYRFNMAEEVVP